MSHLQSSHFSHSLTVVIMSCRIKAGFSVSAELTDYCLWLRLHRCCLTQTNTIVHLGSCLHAQLSLSAVDAERAF